jgi:hypothetical protein
MLRPQVIRVKEKYISPLMCTMLGTSWIDKKVANKFLNVWNS